MKVSIPVKHGLSVTAFKGDAKTLLAFNLTKAKTKNLAGFTIECKPGNNPAYYLFNFLGFKDPQTHTQDAQQPVNSSVNAPFQKFRWLHVPGIFHQIEKVFFGDYIYTVTPRYFKNNSLQPLDANLSLAVKINVAPFVKKDIALGFTRGFVQSQAFVSHFGKKALIKPKDTFLFNTNDIAGTNNEGKTYSFKESYEWLGFTARERIFDLLSEAKNNKKTTLDVFAYDLYEPDIYAVLLDLAKEGRIRMISDKSSLHHDKTRSKNEDRFEDLLIKAAGNSDVIKRGVFGSIAHDKIFVLKENNKAIKVLTGSTNFSVTGMYVNSNHVLVTDNKDVAELYAAVFQEAWDNDVSLSFRDSGFANRLIPFAPASLENAKASFSPHRLPFAHDNLQSIADRVTSEEKINKKNGSVLFAVMGITNGTGPVYPTLRKIHATQSIFSYGISDAPGGIFLFKPGRKTGVLLTGKTANSKLPPPFSAEPGIGSAHQIHHKFVVCGFNAKDPVVWMGSSNLAENPEQKNGDNLIAIRDEDIITAFALEAIALVDHFHFRNAHASKTKTGKSKTANIIDSDTWTAGYYDSKDLHFNDRMLFI